MRRDSLEIKINQLHKSNTPSMSWAREATLLEWSESLMVSMVTHPSATLSTLDFALLNCSDWTGAFNAIRRLANLDFHQAELFSYRI